MAKKKQAKQPATKGKSVPTKKATVRPAAKAPARAGRKPAPKILKPAPRNATKTAKVITPKWLPTGYHQITARLVVPKTREAIAFYKSAFGAEEVMVFEHGGIVMHAEIKIGDSRIHLNDAMPSAPNTAPTATNLATGGVDLYVANCDATFTRAIKAGANSLMPVMDSFWGDRCGVVKDPFGHVWMISTHQKDMTPQEISAAAAAAFAANPGCDAVRSDPSETAPA